MARGQQLETPRGRTTRRGQTESKDRFGRFTEWIARAMGTPMFLAILTLFTVAWLAWNTLMPLSTRFDSSDNGFTALTLVLSLQASYAAPLILLAQNRQDDRDRVQIEQDRQRSERNLTDTEYLAREVVALRMSIDDMTKEVMTRDMLRQELRAVLEELERKDEDNEAADSRDER